MIGNSYLIRSGIAFNGNKVCIEYHQFDMGNRYKIKYQKPGEIGKRFEISFETVGEAIKYFEHMISGGIK